MRATRRSRQRGVVLFIALIVLVAMSLAGIALIRGVDTGSVIAGNIAFRQTAMHVGDNGIEAARNWLLGQAATALYYDNTGAGYYATWAPNVVLVGTPTGSQVAFDWSTAINVTTPAPPAGYSVSYVLHRMCSYVGNPSSLDGPGSCVKLQGVVSSSETGTKVQAQFGQMAISVPSIATYRVTVRVVGPRNAVSYVQAVVY